MIFGTKEMAEGLERRVGVNKHLEVESIKFGKQIAWKR